jgi:hypothetical protein
VLDVLARVNPGQLLHGGARRIVVLQEVVQVPPVQLVRDRAEASRLLGMASTHLVQSAGRV